MTYEEARNYIQSLIPRGIQPGLDTVRELCHRLGSPQNGLCFIHIAGTNGKGSVGAFLSAILMAAGLTAARFVSPAVEDYLEMFTVDGRPVPEDLYTECADRVRAAVSELERDNIFPTSFEAETAIAFLLFSRLRPDYVLLECGMGGLLDATNIITSPYASVITSVSTDHTQFLGETLAEIAAKKCGIIKDNCPVITCDQPDEVMEMITRCSYVRSSPLYIADDISDIRASENGTTFRFDGENYFIPLAGAYQPQNAAVAIQAARVLGISEKSIREGLSRTKWPYRFERVGRFILDGAHNKGAAEALADSIKQYIKGSTAYICGCFKDKDYGSIAKLTAPYADMVYCVTPSSQRGLNAAVLCGSFKSCGVKAEAAKSIADAVARTHGYDNVIVFGSLSILAEAKAVIEGTIKNGTMQQDI